MTCYSCAHTPFQTMHGAFKLWAKHTSTYIHIWYKGKLYTVHSDGYNGAGGGDGGDDCDCDGHGDGHNGGVYGDEPCQPMVARSRKKRDHKDIYWCHLPFAPTHHLSQHAHTAPWRTLRTKTKPGSSTHKPPRAALDTMVEVTSTTTTGHERDSET